MGFVREAMDWVIFMHGGLIVEEGATRFLILWITKQRPKRRRKFEGSGFGNWYDWHNDCLRTSK